MPWEIFITDEVSGWLDDLATANGSYRRIVYAIEVLAEVGPEPQPATGRPYHRLSHPRPQRTPSPIRRHYRGADVVHLRPLA
jgi:hypothetical protein